jgi:hypothetical protein
MMRRRRRKNSIRGRRVRRTKRHSFRVSRWRRGRKTYAWKNPGGRRKSKIAKLLIGGAVLFVLYKIVSKSGEALAQKVIVGPRL